MDELGVVDEARREEPTITAALDAMAAALAALASEEDVRPALDRRRGSPTRSPTCG